MVDTENMEGGERRREERQTERLSLYPLVLWNSTKKTGAFPLGLALGFGI